MITQSPVEAVTDRLFDAMLATFDIAALALGIRLGFYGALQEMGEATPAQLAAEAGTNERYTREWLEQQAATGLLEVATPSESDDQRSYRMVEGTEPLLTDTTGETTVIHFARSVIASVLALRDVEECFRTGKGLPFSHYGDEMRDGQALGTRWGYLNDLPNIWMPAMPDVHERLLNTPGGRIADIGFGAGWSSIALARAYPDARVDGFDLDASSVKLAQQNADEAGLSGRVQFQVRDAGDPSLSGQFDFACAFECVHDLAHPVAVLDAMRRLVGPDGTCLVVDELTADAFEAPANDTTRFFYGYSVFHCLPGSMDGENPAGTGTVMRQSTLRKYAADAGFASVDVLPVENDFFRLYRLNP